MPIRGGNMNRYSLIKNGGYSDLKVIALPKSGKIKSSLREIDEFTTQYENGEELLDDVKCGQYKLEDVSKLKGPQMYLKNYNKMTITYQQYGRVKETGILYKKNSWVKDTKMVNDTNVDVRDPYFRAVVKEFVKDCAAPGGYDFFVSLKTMSLKVCEYIEKMIYDHDYSDFNREKLMEHMSSYKQYREIILGIKAYREMVAEKTKRKER